MDASGILWGQTYWTSEGKGCVLLIGRKLMISEVVWDKQRASSEPCAHTQAACAVLAFAKSDKASHESNISGHLKAVMTKKLRLPESPQIFYFIRKTSKTILTNYSWIFTKTVSPLLFCSPKTKFLCTLAQEIFCFPWLKLSLGKWPCYLLKIIPAGPAS